ncbi:MAG: serine/threonine-protein kinase, partial [Brachymonas sp.]
MADLPPPISHLGRYDIVRVLGQGAMGVVYEGRDPNLDRRVAIKTVRVVGMATTEIAEYEQRFKTEARSAGRLQHPNIVSVYDSDTHVDATGQTAYIVMEFVQGEDLKHFLDSGKRFSLEQTAYMMADLLAALDYAHKHKIIHRDIKPANMLLTKEGRIKLTDFGVARITDSGEATKTSGGTVGTLKYMSPEQVAGKGVDSSSDLFSAGIVLYQLLTGVRPFDGEGYLDIVSKIVKEDPTPPSQIVGALPPSLDSVVAKALAKSKLDRFADAAA